MLEDSDIASHGDPPAAPPPTQLKMADVDEIVEVFLGFPGQINATQLADYDELFHPEFEGHFPSTGPGGGFQTTTREEWLTAQRAIMRGIPDWNYNGRLWTPLSENDWDEVEEGGERFDRVHVLTRITGTHTGDGPNTLILEGKDYKPTNKRICFPLEWWTLTINQRMKRQIVSLQFIKALDTSQCSTGGYSMIPGLLFSIGKPAAPAPSVLEAPFPCFPPGDAADLEDPSWWELRLQIFRQITRKTDEEKAEIKRLIDRQLTELHQHLDYLNALQNYLPFEMASRTNQEVK